MKAAVLFAPGEKLKVVEVELERPGPGEVMVQLAATGICASDWHTMRGAIPSPTPSVLGHEGAGVVEAVGEGVQSVVAGDHVVLSWIPAAVTAATARQGGPIFARWRPLPCLLGTLVSGARRLLRR